MSTDRDTTRLVRSWLEEGVTALPDRVLDAVLDQVPATPQRRSWWPARRSTQMNRIALLAAAAAAVLVVGFVGYQLLPGVGPGGPPAPTPVISPLPSPSAPAEMQVGALAPGTYLVSGFTEVPFAVTVPSGWSMNNDGFITKGGPYEGAVPSTGVALAPWLITHIYADSCQWNGTLHAVGTRQLLATGLAEQKGHAATAPIDVTLGGRPASRVALSVPAAFDRMTCQSGVLRLWPDPGPDENGGHRIYPGQTTVVYALENAGKAWAVFTVTNEGSAPGDVAELEAILASVQFVR